MVSDRTIGSEPSISIWHKQNIILYYMAGQGITLHMEAIS